MAHERLRARSRWQRLSSERQVRDVLLQILSERRAGGSAVALPRVAAHAIGVGRRLGLALSQLDDIVRAAEMQDIGMLAVPEAVLRKRGTLEPEEWAMIRRHPVVGERILAAAPALAAGRAPRALQLRALRRLGLPRRAGRRGDPARLARDRRLHRLRRHDLGAPLPRGAAGRDRLRGAPPLRRAASSIRWSSPPSARRTTRIDPRDRDGLPLRA